MELQDQLNTYNRDLRSVKMRIAGLQREERVNSVTTQQVTTLPVNVPLYRSVGKAFFAAKREEVETYLQDEVNDISKSQRDLSDRQEYLERRIASNAANIQELIR
jgi:chaperonin cofactor prefoldin